MSEPGGKTAGSPGPDHRWLVLVTVAIAQLMVVLDATVVNIALPRQRQQAGGSLEGGGVTAGPGTEADAAAGYSQTER
jgi:hypothetical protein